jgi:hypothetical protein
VLLTEKPRRLGFGIFAGAGVQYGVLGKDVDLGVSVGVGLTYRIGK